MLFGANTAGAAERLTQCLEAAALVRGDDSPHRDMP
jgi:hypothetical protein